MFFGLILLQPALYYALVTTEEIKKNTPLDTSDQQRLCQNKSVYPSTLIILLGTIGEDLRVKLSSGGYVQNSGWSVVDPCNSLFSNIMTHIWLHTVACIGTELMVVVLQMTRSTINKVTNLEKATVKEPHEWCLRANSDFMSQLLSGIFSPRLTSVCFSEI